ncbi:tetratricopeptide repeat protein [Candidatus Woesearchaeota archaeon]|nr:tetratricopeptide repeat protein [Candidatus Woesearchaeota archaeon]
MAKIRLTPLEYVKAHPDDLGKRIRLRESERRLWTKPELKSRWFRSVQGETIEEKLADCEDSLSTNPWEVETLLDLGNAASEDEKYWKTAIFTFNDVISLVVHNQGYKESGKWMYEAQKGRGMVYEKKEHFDKAIKAYENAKEYAKKDQIVEIDKLIKNAEAKTY